MSGAQRRKRAARRALVLGDFRSPGTLAENPNRGKRHVAPVTARLHSFTDNESQRIRDARRTYVPLHVATVIERDRSGRMRWPGFQTQGYRV